MTEPLSEQQLAEIRARAAAAAPGHWGTHYDQQGTYSIEAQPRLFPGYGSTSEGLVATIRAEDSDAEQAYRNARFIAHAREDVPELLAEIERLRAELAKYVGHEPTIAEEMTYLRDENNRLAAENEGLNDLRLRAIDKGDQLRDELARAKSAQA